MKILIIHQYYLGPGEPGGSRFNEFARLWSEAGHQVTVIAGTVSYATGETPARYRGRWVTREMDGPVTVYRCHVPDTYAKSFAGRMWAFFAFTLSASTAAVTTMCPDVIIATSPPLVVSIPGWLAARARWPWARWIFEVRDLWPETAVTVGALAADAPLTRALYVLERATYRLADRINVLTPAFREDIVTRGLSPESKIFFVPNGADAQLFSPATRDNWVREDHGWGDRTVFLYAGAHGRCNALMQLVEAASLLGDRADIHIACVGDGIERAELAAEIERRSLDNIKLYGAQPKDTMPDWVNAADVGVAVLQDNQTFRTVYPNKVFDYMACERPTLLAIDGVARELVCEQAQAGVFVQPENAKAIAQAMREFADAPERRAALGKNGRRWVLANATREVLASRYLGFMQKLVAEARGAS